METERKVILLIGLIIFSIYLVYDVGVLEGAPNANEASLGITKGVKENGDGVKYLVNPDKLSGGGPPRDGIPSIDDPAYIGVDEADAWIQDDEQVLAISRNGFERAYPLKIMVWHEIVNDIVGGEPILITYCPLCGTGIAYEREVKGRPVEFGTSGKLYNSNLVMYDRLTETLWTQVDGRAIIGELTGLTLNEVSIDTVQWGDWKQKFPDAEVLSKDTSFVRDYGRDPYADYYYSPDIFFPVDYESDLVHPKTMVHGIRVGGAYKAYPEKDVLEAGRIEDTVGGVDIIVEADDIGRVSVTRKDDGGEIVKEEGFWFAWYAFHPSTEIHIPG